jgi:hypothetical protein
MRLPLVCRVAPINSTLLTIFLILSGNQVPGVRVLASAGV